MPASALMLARGSGHSTSFILMPSFRHMEKANMKTAGAVVIVLIIVLLFSWQYIGSEEEKSPMEGEWKYASSEVLTVSSSPVGSAGDANSQNVKVVRNGGIITMSDADTSLDFAIVSDYEAISVDHGYNVQLYLHAGTLFFVQFNLVEIGETSVLTLGAHIYTRDGAYDPDEDDFDLDGTEEGVTADVYNIDNAKAGSELVSFAIDTESCRLAKMSVSIDGAEKGAVGFVKGIDDRYTIFCMTVDGIVFNQTYEYGFITSVTGVDSTLAVKYYVFDGDRYLAEDVYGLGKGTAIHYRDGHDITLDAHYDDGRLCSPRDDGSTYLFAVTAEGINGGGFALTPGDTVLVKVDGKLWVLDSGQII